MSERFPPVRYFAIREPNSVVQVAIAPITTIVGESTPCATTFATRIDPTTGVVVRFRTHGDAIRVHDVLHEVAEADRLTRGIEGHPLCAAE